MVTNRLSRKTIPPMPVGSSPANSRPPAWERARSNSISFLKAASHGDASVPYRPRMAAWLVALILLASTALRASGDSASSTRCGIEGRPGTVISNTTGERHSSNLHFAIHLIAFELDGQKFTALNGGPMFRFTEAVSFVVRCDSQQEVDDYWSKLSAGGSEGQCGWLKDKFGLSWQIVPARLLDLIKQPKAWQAMLRMKKLDIAELERAAQS